MVGEKIKELRIKKGYSISELAKEAGVSKSYLSYIERDLQKNPSLQFLTKIADTLNTNIEFLLGQDGDEEALDDEWIALVRNAIDTGVSKNEFQQYIDYVKFNRWKELQRDKD